MSSPHGSLTDLSEHALDRKAKDHGVLDREIMLQEIEPETFLSFGSDVWRSVSRDEDISVKRTLGRGGWTGVAGSIGDGWLGRGGWEHMGRVVGSTWGWVVGAGWLRRGGWGGLTGEHMGRVARAGDWGVHGAVGWGGGLGQ